MPIRDFHIWGNLPRHPIERLSHHTSRQSGLLLERWSAFARLRRTTSFEKFIRVLIVSQLLDYMFVDLLIHGYFHTLVRRDSHVQLGCLHFFFSMTTAIFAFSGSDDLTFLFVDSASKAGFIYVLDHSVLVSQPQSVCYQIPRTGQDHFDERPVIYHSI